ncbi:MAG: histidine kinase [Planctomycetaceae bacterium]|nr:histidine kinase [Planctomycetaceae bacterium]
MLKWWQRYRWYHLSAVLAGMNLFTVVASLALSHLLLNIYSLSVRTDEKWTRHVISIEELAESVAAVNVPGNEVLLTRDFERERFKLNRASGLYLQRSQEIGRNISSEFPSTIVEPLLQRLALLSQHVEIMQKRGIVVIDLISEGNDVVAGVEIASANQHLVQALIEIRILCQLTREYRDAAVAKHVIAASFLRRIERAIGVLVIGLLIAIVVNGVRLARQMNEAETKLGRLSAIVEHSEDAIFSEDLTGKITSWNQGAEHLYGYTAQEVIGQSPSCLITDDRLHEAESIELEVRGGHPVQQIETIRRRKDGVWVDVELTISPVRNEHGELIGISQIARDIRELRASERAMQEAREASEEANRSKSEFLANMSHEIRTPMTAILGFTEILSQSVDQPDEIAAVETIRKNGEHLTHLINEILDLSKIEAGKLTVECSPVSVPKLVREVVDLMRVKADAKGLVLRTEYPDLMPETILTDPTRLRQILINLVGNSIKFTEAGLIRIAVRLKREPGKQPLMQFDVMDSGIGMNQSQMDKLFQPFSQTDNSMTRRFGGTGLGLTICQRLAQNLGGTISVFSRVCVGTTFTVTIGTGSLEGIPLVNPRLEAAAVPKPQRSLSAECRTAAQVLLAEDGADNQRLIKYILNKAGVDVTCCDNGVVAHDLALERFALGRPFDLVLMDMQMPILDGYSATRQLRAMGYKGPIIALTANAMSGDREKCMSAGCDDYVMKPIDRYLLVEVVSRFVSQNSRTTDAV